MNEQQRNKWNEDKLVELYPSFRDKMREILIELESCGIRPRIHEAWRSEEDQLKAFNSKHSKLKYGFHNVTAPNGTKEALAVDMVDDDIVNNKKTDHTYVEFLLRLFAAARMRGLTTGIEWGLEEFAIEAIHNAIATGNWKTPVRHGWDEAHVQPVDITPKEARDGKRPS